MRILITAIALVAMSIYVIAQDQKSTDPSPNAIATESTLAETDPVKLEPKGEAHPPSIWMQQKLKHSQKIFAGMVEGDLIQVEDSARRLQIINRLEGFARGKSKGYRTQLRLFQHANEEVLKGAEEKNLDRVTLGFNQLTVSCVACHKQLRNSE